MDRKFMDPCGSCAFMWLGVLCLVLSLGNGQSDKKEGSGCSSILPQLSDLKNVILNEDIFGSLNGDLQPLLDCMPNGGVLNIELKKMELSRTLVIQKGVEIKAHAKNQKGLKRTALTCPDNGPAVEIRASGVAIRGLDISDCVLTSNTAALHIENSKNTTLTDIDCKNTRNKQGPGCISLSKSNAEIRHSNFTHSHGFEGGALWIGNGSSVVVSDSAFMNNTAKIGGGAVYVQASKADFSHVIFEKNTAVDDGGAIFAKSEEKTEVLISSAEFIANSIHGSYEHDLNFRAGGAIAMYGNGVRLHIEAATFANNTAVSDGGAIAVLNGSDMHVMDATFVGNEAFQGGAIYLQSPLPHETVVEIERCLFRSNKVYGDVKGYRSMGGAMAMFEEGVSVKINGAKFTKNDSPTLGGAMLVAGPSLVNITDSIYVENHAAIKGAAIANTANPRAKSFLYIQDVGFEDNWASSDEQGNEGGALFLFGATLTVRIVGETEFAGNLATTCGGAISVSHGSLLEIEDALFRINEASHGRGGAICLEDYTYGGSVSLSNAKMFKNRASDFGGAISVGGAKSVIAMDKGTNLTMNMAPNGGGGVYLTDVEIFSTSNTTFLKNEASSGGAILANNLKGTPMLLDVHKTALHENQATSGIGGAVSLTGRNITAQFEGISCVNNIAGGSGGAIGAYNALLVNIFDSSVENNVAKNGSGGAIWITSTPLTNGTVNATLSNSIFRNNTAGQDGGVISAESNSAVVNLNASQIVANNAIESGGALAITSGADLYCENSMFANNFANTGGAIWAKAVEQDTDIIVRDSNFTYNMALHTRGKGGAMALKGKGVSSHTFQSNFVDNRATRRGGAIFANEGKDLVIEDCFFEGNNADNGGAIAARATDTLTPVQISGTAFHKNFAAEVSDIVKSWGGAIHLYGGGITCSLDKKTQLKSNHAISGGAIAIFNGATFTALDSLFEKNIALNGSGGAIQAVITPDEYYSATTVTVSVMSCDFIENICKGSAGDGGAIHTVGRNVTLRVGGNSTFTRNSVDDVGGAIANFLNGAMFINGAKFEGNQAASGGGLFAMAVHEVLHVSMTNADFVANKAFEGYGGAIDLHSAGSMIDASIAHKVTFVENVAVLGGGAIFARNGTHLNVADADMVSNVAKDGFGGALLLWVPPTSKKTSTITMTDSRVIRNTAGGKENSGGGVSLLGKSLEAIVSSVLFEGNVASGFGGGLRMSVGEKLTLQNTTFFRNVGASGGALWLEEKGDQVLNAVIDACKFTENAAHIGKAKKGGAIGMKATKTGKVACTVTGNTTFTNNTAAIGGALYSDDAILKVKSAHFRENGAKRGGAVWAQANHGGILTVSKSEFVSNSAEKDGGVCGSIDFKGAKLTAKIDKDVKFVNNTPSSIAPEMRVNKRFGFLKKLSCKGEGGG